MIEVEVKAKIDDFDSIKSKLDKLGAVKTITQIQEDLYFKSPIVDFAKTDEALRIRTVKTCADEKILITYKGPKLNSKSKTREEIELAIENSEKTEKILEHLGFKKVRVVKKEREYYSYKNFEISLDDVEGLDPYMEIEIGVEDGIDYHKAQDSIFELYDKIGINDGFENTSYLELLENVK